MASNTFNPLAWLRQHSKWMMAILVVVLIIGFTATLGTGVDPIIEWFSGRSGGGGDNPLYVTWKGGSLYQHDLDQLRRDKSVAFRFMNELLQIAQSRAAVGQTVQPLVEPIDDQVDDAALIAMLVLAKKAEEMGVVVDDLAVEKYLDSYTGRALDPSEYGAILARITHNTVTQNQIYRVLKLNLLARQMRINSSLGLTGTTPASLWEVNLRLEQKAKIQFTQVAVADYLDKVGEPSDPEIQKLYDEGKERAALPWSSEPGFRRLMALDFHYLEGDYDAVVAEEMKKITDAEVAEYYEKHKPLYLKVPPVPGAGAPIPGVDLIPGVELTPPVGPEFTPPTVPATPATPPAAPEKKPETPATPETPEKKTEPAPAPATPEKKPEPAPAPPATPEKKEEPAPAPATPEKKEEPAPATEPEKKVALTESFVNVADEPAGEKKPDAAPEKKEEPAAPAPAPAVPAPAPEKKPEAPAPAAPAAPAPAPATPAEPAPATPAAPAPATPAAPAPATPAVPAPAAPGTPPAAAPMAPAAGPILPAPLPTDPTKFKPLEEVKEEIRKTIAEERAQAKIKAALDAALADVKKYTTVYRKWAAAPPDRRPAQPAAPSPEELGKKYGLKGGRTGLVDSPRFAQQPLGKTFDFSTRQFLTLAQSAYQTQGSGGDVQFYVPRQTYEMDFKKTYISWIVAERKASTPELKEEGIRDEVIKAWKMGKAYDLAKAAAEGLAEEARKTGKPLKEALPNRKVYDSKEFAWYSSPQNGAVSEVESADPPAPAAGEKPAAEKPKAADKPADEKISFPGNEFMQSIFVLKKGQIGVAANEPHTFVYVVQMENDTTLAEAKFDDFLPFQQQRQLFPLASNANQDLLEDWHRDLLKEYNVVWHQTPRRIGGDD